MLYQNRLREIIMITQAVSHRIGDYMATDFGTKQAKLIGYDTLESRGIWHSKHGPLKLEKKTFSSAHRICILSMEHVFVV